jgi:hypothetical protein
MEIVIKSSIFLIPTLLESVLKSYEACGNMGKYGLFLRLYYKRNVFYVSIVFSILFYKYINRFYLLTLNVLFLINYLAYVKNWNDFLSII